MVPIPDPAAQEAIAAKLDDFAKALERHPNWTPPRPHPGLLHVWDFVKRSHYIMTEIDNIRHGRPLKYPDQIPAQEGGEAGKSSSFADATDPMLTPPTHASAKDDEEKARMSFTDVVTRTITINEIIRAPAMLALMGQGPIDFGDEVKAKGKDVQEAIMSLPE